MNATPESGIKPVLEIASQEPGLGFDPDEVLRRGQRAVLRRRVLGAGAGLAVVLAVVAGAAQFGGEPRALPPSSDGSSPVVSRPTTSAEATLTLGDATYIVRYTVTGGAEDRLEYGQAGVDGAAGSSVSSDGEGMTFGGAGDGNVVLGVVPADTRSVSAFLAPGKDQAEMVQAELPGTKYRAFAIVIHGSGTIEDLRSIDWEDGTGRAHTTAPSDFRTAVFTVPSTDDAIQVWADADSKAWGARMPGTTTTAPEPFGGEPMLMYVGREDATGAAGSTWWVTYGLLPAGATDVQLRLTDGSTVVGEVYHQQLEAIDATAFAAELDTPGDGQQGGVVAEVTWVNPDGTRGSFRPDR